MQAYKGAPIRATNYSAQRRQYGQASAGHGQNYRSAQQQPAHADHAHKEGARLNADMDKLLKSMPKMGLEGLVDAEPIGTIYHDKESNAYIIALNLDSKYMPKSMPGKGIAAYGVEERDGKYGLNEQGRRMYGGVAREVDSDLEKITASYDSEKGVLTLTLPVYAGQQKKAGEYKD